MLMSLGQTDALLPFKFVELSKDFCGTRREVSLSLQRMKCPTVGSENLRFLVRSK